MVSIRPTRAGRGALHAPLGGFNPPLQIVVVHQPVLMRILRTHAGDRILTIYEQTGALDWH